jgi:type II secretory pathway component PulF
MFDLIDFLFGLLWYAILVLLPGCALAVLVHYMLSLPAQRRDRALFFLDMIETALDRGEAAERAILSAALTRDRTMGFQFYLLAAYIESGRRFGEALERVPAFLPPQVNAILRASEKLGDIRKGLPACREILRVPPDTVRTTVQYMVAILLLFAPVATFMIWLISVFVIPRFRDVAAGMDVRLWPETVLVFEYSGLLMGYAIAVFTLLFIATLFYVGGPGLVRVFRFQNFPLVDWFAWHVPWKQKKLQRTFSAMLAVLLDGGLPETEAVRLAGNCTANEICHRRTGRILVALQQGEKLQDAVRAFDDSGEFHWRLTNAAHGHGGFLEALRGWHAALDAKAFQQEEATAHFALSGLVIMNGVLVGLIATAMFGILVAILRGAVSL